MLNAHLDTFVVVYLDDVLIFSKTIEDHFNHLQEIFTLLRKHHFFVKLKKCSFFRTEATFLGHDINEKGFQINANKLKKLMDWPEPTTKKELHSFLGFMQFLAGFIQAYAKIVAPLTNLLRKDTAWTWGRE